MKPNKPRGFTLIEVLVATAVLVVIGVLAFTVLSQMLKSRSQGRDAMNRFGEVQLAVQMISRDIQQIQPRPVRTGFGEPPRAATLADGRYDYSLEITRGGWRNPISRPRGTLQRVAYRVDEEGILIRAHWLSLDYGSNEPFETELLQGVELIELRFLDSAREWHTQWPPLQNQGGPSPMPIAVEVNIELDDFGLIRRLLEIPS